MKKKKEKVKLTKEQILKGAGQETAQHLTMQALKLGTSNQKQAQLEILKHTSVALIANHIFNMTMQDGEGNFNNTFVMNHLDEIKEEILDAVDELAEGLSSGNVKLSEF